MLVLIYLLLLFFSPHLFSQTYDNSARYYKNTITLNITRLILREVRLGYERNLDVKNAVRATIGIQYPKAGNNTITTLFLGYFPNYFRVSHGIYISGGYNYIFAPRHHFYISGELYYSYYFYDHKNYNNGSGMNMDLYQSVQSMRLTKSGIKFLIGKKANIFTKDKVGFQFDFFFGLGIQYRQRYLTIYKENVSDSGWEILDPPKKDNIVGFFPTMHAGILICVPFSK